jgi:uncharacterized protein (DUF2147 family)
MYITDFVRSSVAVICMVVGAAALAGGVAAQGQPADVAGLWIDHTGQGAVEIAPCGAAGGNRVCGRVVWLKNPEHRSRTGKLICGTQILGDLRRETANAWGEGWIYNPEDEERFSAALELASADTLKVTGYLGFRFLGETFTWKRATTSLQRCAPDQSAGTR